MLIRTSKLQIKIAAVLMLSLAATPVFAGHNKHKNSRAYYDGNYAYARVVKARPIIEIIRVPQNHRVCYQQPGYRRGRGHRSVVPTVVGATIGGVIGHQFGSGHGRTAATIAGAVIGGAVGSHVQHHRAYPQPVRGCHGETRWFNEERVVGWDVTWKFHGRKYHSTVAEHPGKRIRVHLDTVYR